MSEFYHMKIWQRFSILYFQSFKAFKKMNKIKLNEYITQTINIYIWGVIQSTSPLVSLVADPWRESRRTVFALSASTSWHHNRSRSQKCACDRCIPLYDWRSASYHPGLDYCLICWCKSDVLTIEKILYEYSLNLFCRFHHL